MAALIQYSTAGLYDLVRLVILPVTEKCTRKYDNETGRF